jgi:alginate O-acetyltransferase complex protein AlgI
VNFVQNEYAIFLGLVFAAYWLLRDRRLQNLLLLFASMVFYGWVHPWFLLLMGGSALLDFSLAQAIERYPKSKRLFVALSVLGNLSLLGYFKYTNFFIENVRGALQAAGVTADLGTLDVLLPVGISFYTFQTMGYTLDVARGELKARTNVVDYALYVSFFPQLVAGPIERAGKLLPQIEASRALSWVAVRSGLGLLVWGGFKKLVIADAIAPYVDKVYVLDQPAGPLLWVATFGFMIQIFTDFSAYTDMARGSARLLGFELQENFREPFLARTTIEFWQRWHMSLSTWLRDYLLGPLVGESTSRIRFAWATITTFVIIGFWHGASWNFVLFGLYNGLWVVFYGLVTRRIPASWAAIPGGNALAIAFHLVAVSLVGSMFFREQHVGRIVGHLTRNPFAATPDEWVATVVLGSVIATGCVPLLLGWLWDKEAAPRLAGSPWLWPMQTTAWAAMGAAMFVFTRVTARDFVYFQF